MLAQQRKRQQREEQIMLSLANLTYATRNQLQIVNNLGGDRNAHRILHRMEKDKLISSIRTGRKIYFLSNKGKNVIGSEQGELKKKMITHTLMRNDLYIKFNRPNDWAKEVPIKQNGEIVLIPDAMFTKNDQYHFVEIDNKQSMRTNYDKIKRYADLFKMIFKQYKHHPTLIWYTLSDVRKQKLGDECKKYGIKFITF